MIVKKLNLKYRGRDKHLNIVLEDYKDKINFILDSIYDQTETDDFFSGRSINTTLPLAGGGDFSATRTHSITGLSDLGTSNYLIGAQDDYRDGWEYKSLLGTTNQVTVTHAVGTVTLATPQDIATTSNVTFGTMGCGKLTVDSGTDQSIIIKGTSTGNANIGWIGFYDSDGITRRGSIGDGSVGDDDIYLGADTGYLRLYATAGYISLGTHTYLPDDVVMSLGASLDYSIGYYSTDGEFQIVNGSTLDSNVRLKLDSSGHFDFGAGNLTTTGTLGAGSLTIANGGSLNLQEDITFTGATTENLIKMPDNLLDALSIQEGSNKYVTFDTVNDEEDIFFYKSVDILHTATHADDHALEIDTDAAAYGDVKAIDVDYITGQIDTGQDEGIILINIDETLADGGDVFGLEVLSTDGSANIYGMKVGAVVNPIHQDSGTFANPTKGTDNTIGSSVTDTSIGFTQSPDTITDSNSGFGGFVTGELVVVTGATTGANNTTYTITAVVAGALTVTPQPNTVEDDGATITVEGNVPAMLDGSSGTTTAIFEANSEYILIGAAAVFEEIEFIVTTGASGAGIKPTFWYSIAGSHSFTQFTPVDGTDGFKHTGVVAWDASDLSSHAVNTDTSTYDIKVIRTRGNLTTSPVLGYAKTAATTEYSWDANGDVNIRNLATSGTLGVTGTVTIPTALTGVIRADSGVLSVEGTAVLDADFSSNGILKRTSAGVYGIVTDNSTTWDAAQAGHAMLTSLAAMTYASGSFVSITNTNTASIRTYAQTLSDIGAAASSHAMSTHSDDDTYSIVTSGTLIVGGGISYINDSANTKMTTGLTINQGAADNEILAFKSSDVAHGMTTYAETDTYGSFQKISSDTGGVVLTGLGASIWGFYFNAYYTDDNTDKDTTAGAPIGVNAWKANGVGRQVQGADANTFIIRTGNSTRFIVDEDGDILYDGTSNPYQDYDDIELLAELEVNLDKSKKLKSKEKYKKEDLEDAKILRPFLSTKRLNMLQMGAIRQLNEKIISLNEEIEILKNK